MRHHLRHLFDGAPLALLSLLILRGMGAGKNAEWLGSMVRGPCFFAGKDMPRWWVDEQNCGDTRRLRRAESADSGASLERRFTVPGTTIQGASSWLQREHDFPRVLTILKR
jgi:hypothetical protein